MKRRCLFLLSFLAVLVFVSAAMAAQQVTLPAGVTLVENEAFLGLEADSLTLPYGLSSIGERAFADGRISSVTIPGTVSFIAENAFENTKVNVAQVELNSYAMDYCIRHQIPVNYGARMPEQVSISYDYGDDLYPGQLSNCHVLFMPDNTMSPLTFSSSDPSVVIVDGQGNLTAVSRGTAVITATAANQVSGSCTVTVAHDPPHLEFTLTADGTAYEITGCDSSAYAVTIPAAYNGLPVKKIAGNAFMHCPNLTRFDTEPGQPVFYTDAYGVIYSDAGEKTLVRAPNRFMPDNMSSYQIIPGTVSIAPYAFSGVSQLGYLHIPEGLKTIGDYAFSEVACQVSLYIPSTVTNIGEHLLAGQKSNIPFYTGKDTYAMKFAQAHQIPCAWIQTNEAGAKTAVETDADSQNATDAPAVNISSVYTISERQQQAYSYLAVTRNLGELQKQGYSEIRINMEGQWSEIVFQSGGQTMNGYPVQTGLYGLGYTSAPAWIRGYDMEGQENGVRKVSGNFIFSLPGAYSLGVSGGKDMVLSAIPYKPVFVSVPGNLPVDPSTCYRMQDGRGFQLYVLMFPNATLSLNSPDHLNCVGYYMQDAAGRGWEHSPYYSFLRINMNDPASIPMLNQVSLQTDALKKLYEDAEFRCFAKTSYRLNEDYGKELRKILSLVKESMIGHHYPADEKVARVTVEVNGGYPSSAESVIELDESFFPYTDRLLCSIAHEMVHAVDQSFESVTVLSPSPWLEGRAEYISLQAGKKAGISTDEIYESFDWSVLSDADKADFYSFYYNSTNRITTYPVGYYFYRYLCETYGEAAPCRIMKRLIRQTDATYGMDHETRKAIFKQAVTAETNENVFQDFVRDVIEKR